VSREFDDGPAAAGDESGAIYRRRIPAGVEVYEINGPFFFGAAEMFRETVGQVKGTPSVWIILMRRVSAIDSTGIRMLRALVRGAHRDGARVILVGVHAQPMIALGRADLLDEVGDAGLCGSLDEALAAARTHLGLSPAPRTDPPVAPAA
jgi:SulP family sulfate permease